MHFHRVGGNGRKNLGVDAFDVDDGDDSIALVITLFDGGDEPETLTQTETNAQFADAQGLPARRCTRHLHAGQGGQRAAVHLAEDLRMRARNVTKCRCSSSLTASSAVAPDFCRRRTSTRSMDFHVGR